MDPYECVCEYIWSMRRLLTGLSNQNHCTDTECFTEYPGYQGGSQSHNGGGMFYLTLAILWVLLALVLFYFRPRSLRSSGTEKRPPNDEPRRQEPPVQ